MKLKDNVYWTGVLDFDIRTFDIVMTTEYGTTYNSYIVKGRGKTALIETSKDKFFDEFISRVQSVGFERLDYIILNHTEPDHTGSLEKLLNMYPEVEVVGTKTAIKFVKKIANVDFKSIVVENGQTLSLGGLTLKFISAPFLHWPDSMFTYLLEDNVLFSCDFLGCHYCSNEITNEKINDLFYEQSFKYYYDNILGPFKKYVADALETIAPLNIDMVCTGHGPVLVNEISKYLDLYKIWSEPQIYGKTPIIQVVYVSAYGYTETIAKEIIKGLEESDVYGELVNLLENNISEVMEKIQRSRGFLVGSPTINGDALPPVWEFLSHVNPITHKNMFAGVFGSYGWSGEGISNVEQRLKQLRLSIPAPALKVNFKPNQDELKQAFEFGKEFGGVVKLFK